MKRISRQVILRLRFKNARCPICGGTHQTECPGEEIVVQKDNHFEKEHRSCSNGCLSGITQRHLFCNGTSKVSCQYCSEDGIVTDAYNLLIVQVGEDTANRFAFMKKPQESPVLCPRSIRYTDPCGNGSGTFLSLWTKPGREFIK